MEFEKAKKAVRRVLDQYADDDDIKAATVVVAALNEAYAERGRIFGIRITETVTVSFTDEDVRDVFCRVLGVHRS